MLEKLVQFGEWIRRRPVATGVAAATVIIAAYVALYNFRQEVSSPEKYKNKPTKVYDAPVGDDRANIINKLEQNIPTSSPAPNENQPVYSATEPAQNADEDINHLSENNLQPQPNKIIANNADNANNQQTYVDMTSQTSPNDTNVPFDNNWGILSWLFQPFDDIIYSLQEGNPLNPLSMVFQTTPSDTGRDSSDLSEGVTNFQLQPGIDPMTGLPPQEPLVLRPAWEGIQKYGMVSGSSAGDGKLTVSSWTLNDIISFAYDTPSSQINWQHSFPNDRFDVVANMTQGEEGNIKAYVQLAVEDLGIKAEYAEEVRPVYVLRQIQWQPFNLTHSNNQEEGSGASFFPDVNGQGARYQVNNYSLEDVANYLSGSNRLPYPVFDETNIGGSYSFMLNVNSNDPQDVIKAFEQFGLTLVQEERPISVLNVSYSP